MYFNVCTFFVDLMNNSSSEGGSSSSGSELLHSTKIKKFDSVSESSDFYNHLTESSVADPLSSCSNVYPFSSPSKLSNIVCQNDVSNYEETEEIMCNETLKNVDDKNFCSAMFSNHVSDDDECISTDGQDGTDDSDSEEELEDAGGTEKDNFIRIMTNYNIDNVMKSSAAMTPMFEGSKLSVIQGIAIHFDTYTKHPGVSKETFNDFMQTSRNIILPLKSNMPVDYKTARNVIEEFLIPKIVYDVCQNDCIIYRKGYKSLSSCPVCNSPRYRSSNGKVRADRQVACRRFVYLPIGPRLKRIYGNATLCEIIQMHHNIGTGVDDDNDFELRDIQDAPIWKHEYSESGFFENDARGMSFAFELDGVNPFHSMRAVYSMTPMMLTMLNLPRNVRNLFENIVLLGIIPGKGRMSPNPMAYLEVIVDEMLSLSGSSVYSAYDNAPFNIKVKFLLYVLDYPGMSKVFNLQSSGISGCHYCEIHGIYDKNLSKVVYLNNRNYLPPSSLIRADTKSFTVKAICSSTQPKLRTPENDLFNQAQQAQAVTKQQSAKIAKETGCKGSHPFVYLPGHRLEQAVPDAMHTIKDVVQNIFDLLIGQTNIDKVCKAEFDLGRHIPVETDKHVKRKRKLRQNESAKSKTTTYTDEIKNSMKNLWVLSSTERVTADSRAASLRVPMNFGFKPGPIFSKPAGLKSHDFKQLTCGILKYCLAGLLAESQRNTLFLLLDALCEICSEKQNVRQINLLAERVDIALALFERDWPISLQNITTHLLHHIVPLSIKRFGPVYGTWMFCFERFNSFLCKRSLNKRFPELAAVETYRIFDWVQYMKKTFPEAFIIGNSTSSSTSSTTKNILSSQDKKQISNLFRKHFPMHRPSNSTMKSLSTITFNNHIYTSKVRTGSKLTSSFIYELSDHQVPFSLLCESGAFVRFGQVQCFFGNTMENIADVSNNYESFYFVKVAWFRNVYFDFSVKLWYTNMTCNNEDSSQNVSIVIMDTNAISYPLVTAIDNDKCWFIGAGSTWPCLKFKPIVM